MIRESPTFVEGVRFCTVKGFKVSEPTLMNHCYKHIEGFQKRASHKVDSVDNYGGLITGELVTTPHTFDVHNMRSMLGIDSAENDPQTIKEVIAKGLSKSIELSTLGLINALQDHANGVRQYPLEVIRGLQVLIGIAETLTDTKVDILNITNLGKPQTRQGRRGLSDETANEIVSKILGVNIPQNENVREGLIDQETLRVIRQEIYGIND